MSEGFFDRLVNLVKGASSSFVKDLERDNPEAVYQSAIEAEGARIQAAQDSIGALRLRLGRLAKEREALANQVASLSDMAAGCADSDESKALEYIERRQTVELRLKEIDEEIPKLTEELESVEASIEPMKAGLVQLKLERDQNLTRLRTLQARNDGQDLDAGVPSSASNRALQSVREKIARDGEKTKGLSPKEQRELLKQRAAEQLEALKKAQPSGRAGVSSASSSMSSGPRTEVAGRSLEPEETKGRSLEPEEKAGRTLESNKSTGQSPEEAAKNSAESQGEYSPIPKRTL